MPIAGNQKALMFAQFGVMRFGATRFGYHSGHAFISLAGVQIGKVYTAGRTLVDSLTITDVLDETPNTCSFTVMGLTPAVDDDVIITLGSMNNQTRLFAGHVLQTEQAYAGTKPSNIWHHVSAIDYTYLLSFKKVTKRYVNLSATAIVQDLIATYAAGNGFTVSHVVAGLPVIDEITFTDEDLPSALTRLKQRIGAYWYVDYLKDLHFFLTETSQSPADLTETHPSFQLIGVAKDGSQRLNQVKFEGGGVNALEAVAVGDTILPVQDAAWYQPAGGVVVSGPQHITYTGVQGGEAGSLVGSGVTPSSAPLAIASAGAGIEDGVHTYAYTWVTAAGETLPSPLVAVMHGPIPAPSVAPTINSLSGNSSGTTNLTIGTTYEYAYTYSASATASALTDETAAGTAVAYTAILAATLGAPYAQFPNIRVTASADTRVNWIHLFRRVQGVGAYKFLFGTTNVTQNMVGYHAGGADLPTANAVFNRTTLAGISVGPATTTSRKIYRTVAAGAQLKLQQTIANNTATTGTTDSTADASLGANAPTADTSALPQPNGQVNAGSTSIIVASPAFAFAGGGWAVIGNGEQVIRYTGVSGNTLTGIPATGVGAVVAPVTYNSTITAASTLVGIPASGAGSIQYQILKGDPVNLLVTVDNVSAQTALAASVGGDGVIEERLQDRRLSETEALARAQARLDQDSSIAESLRYRSRDLGTKAGKTITVNLGAPTNISGAFKIQRVTISDFDSKGQRMPTFSVEASSSRFSFEHLLRQGRKVV